MAFAIWFMLSILRGVSPPYGGNRSLNCQAMAFGRWRLRTTGSTGHQYFSNGKRMVGGRFPQTAGAFDPGTSQGQWLRRFCLFASRPTQFMADGAFAALINILQQHRLELLRLSGSQFHRADLPSDVSASSATLSAHNQHFFVGADDAVIKRRAFLTMGLCGAQRQVGGLITTTGDYWHWRRSGVYSMFTAPRPLHCRCRSPPAG